MFCKKNLTVYNCVLLGYQLFYSYDYRSKTPKEIIDLDLNKEYRVAADNLLYKPSILVAPKNRRYAKEIITGINIPIFDKKKKFNFRNSKRNASCFVELNEGFNEMNSDDIVKYIAEHSDVDSYTEQLENAIQQGKDIVEAICLHQQQKERYEQAEKNKINHLVKGLARLKK